MDPDKILPSLCNRLPAFIHSSSLHAYEKSTGYYRINITSPLCLHVIAQSVCYVVFESSTV